MHKTVGITSLLQIVLFITLCHPQQHQQRVVVFGSKKSDVTNIWQKLWVHTVSPCGLECSDGSLVVLLWQQRWYVTMITQCFKSQHGKVCRRTVFLQLTSYHSSSYLDIPQKIPKAGFYIFKRGKTDLSVCPPQKWGWHMLTHTLSYTQSSFFFNDWCPTSGSVCVCSRLYAHLYVCVWVWERESNQREHFFWTR